MENIFIAQRGHNPLCTLYSFSFKMNYLLKVSDYCNFVLIKRDVIIRAICNNWWIWICLWSTTSQWGIMAVWHSFLLMEFMLWQSKVSNTVIHILIWFIIHNVNYCTYFSLAISKIKKTLATDQKLKLCSSLFWLDFSVLFSLQKEQSPVSWFGRR